ncbi:hypothetical protein MP228_001022 [Amoeboaphelidium protococcarum]|nr:hypothetical protein MP228_001022 [Amoeboaphelidium protococcarum]
MVTSFLEPFATDPSKWRLRVKDGRQTWHYVDAGSESSSKEDHQSIVEKYWLGTLDRDLGDSDQLPVFQDKAKSSHGAAERGFNFFKQLLTEDGHWAGEYGGPLFLLGGMVIVYQATGVQFEEAQRLEIIRYVKNTRAKEGGWGLHIEGESIVLCTVLNYVVLRLLGVSASDPVCVDARQFILNNGGATHTPSWGKFWLSVLNVYDWQGVNPLLPELWLLPYALPFHPARLWCHARQIYLPMSYIYAKRYQVECTELIEQLRSELYPVDYKDIDWVAARDQVAQVDCYAPHHWLLDVANTGMNLFESFAPQWAREKALKEVLYQIRCDDANTDCISIGPISKMINMLVVYLEDRPKSAQFQRHLDRCQDYLWIANDGMRMQGTNGSQLWDTAFAAVAVSESKLIDNPSHQQTLSHVLHFLDDCQIKKNVNEHERCYRDVNLSAFPFSTRDCGWVVSDCTAEGIRAVMTLQSHPDLPKLISDERIIQCMQVLMDMQNDDGGFASYEKRRGPFWLEYLNPSEVFGEIMVDYSYVECTSSVVQALSAFEKQYSGKIDASMLRRVKSCIADGIDYIQKQQRADGSWFGSWGVCFTYAGWFALEALACVGETYENSECVRRGCEFLVGKQRQDGGWGESYLACTQKQYVQHEQSQVVNTAWVMLSLMAAKYPQQEVIKCGLDLLIQRQQKFGDWKQEAIEGVFNKTCMISYPNYKFIFPIWAMSRYSKLYE